MTETYYPIDVGTLGFKGLECKSLSDTHLGLKIVLGDLASERSVELTNLRHYAIYTGEDCIDVASEFPPTFTSARLDA